jgi:hypothetical protein
VGVYDHHIDKKVVGVFIAFFGAPLQLKTLNLGNYPARPIRDPKDLMVR